MKMFITESLASLSVVTTMPEQRWDAYGYLDSVGYYNFL
jgi:hypothetical protein